MRTTLAALSLLLVLLPATASARPSPEDPTSEMAPLKVTWGAEGLVLLPLSDEMNGYEFGGGVGARMYIDSGRDDLWWSIRAGLAFYAPDSSLSNAGLDVTSSQVSLMGGPEFALGNQGLFAYAEGGFVHLAVTVSSDLAEVSESESWFGLGGGVGMDLDPVDLRAGLYTLNVGEFSDYIGFSLAATLRF